MKRANTQDMNMMLNGMLTAGDNYNVKCFVQVVPTCPIYYISMYFGALGAMIGGLFQDEFGSARIHNAYLGLTNNVMNFAVLDDWKVDQLAMTKTFNLANITKVRCNDSRRALTAMVWFGKTKIKFTLRKKVRKTDLNQQAECATIIKNYFDQLAAMLKAQKKAA